MLKRTLLTKEQAKERLKECIKYKDVITLGLLHVSSSGMSRRFCVFYYDKKLKRIMNISEEVGILLGIPFKFNGRNDYVVVGGCGMDMAFWLVNEIKTILYGKKCYREGFSGKYDCIF